MATFKCQTCGGVYVDPQVDGSHYAHRCPPLSVAELEAAMDAGTVALDVDASADKLKIPARGKLESAGDFRRRVLERLALTRAIERPNVRDESIVKAESKTTDAVIASEGLGRVELPADALDPAIGLRVG